MKRAKIVLMRHGECEGGAILRGQTDVALTDNGLVQMQQALTGLPTSLSHVFSSPLARCRGFSRQVATQFNLPLQCLPQFKEIDFGVWDGQSFEAIYQASPSEFDAYWQQPWALENTPENAESVVDFSTRVESGFMQVVDQLWDIIQQTDVDSDPDLCALVVTHGGVMRCLLGYVLNAGQCNGLFANLAIPYAAIIEIDVYWSELIDDKTKHQAMDSQKTKVSFSVNWPNVHVISADANQAP